MLFTSFVFIAFLLAILAVYWLLPGPKTQNFLLLFGSLAFYAWGEPRLVVLILVCALTGFLCGLMIERRSDLAGWFVALGSTVAFGILFTFKYFDFFVESMAALSAKIGLSFDPMTLGLLLPIGISFFTFQTVGYLVDVARGQCRAERNPVDFFLFVTFFPQLVAGPIERANHLLPQIKRSRRLEPGDLQWGVYSMLQGYAKKMVVADNLAPIVNRLFEQDNLTGPLVAVGLVGFAFQIYCDFSGYTDIARGTARCMGFRILQNFDQPYFSRSPTEFWHRWHMTLSTWFRDYVFIPLGGSRRDPWRSRFNLFATFLLSGLWHGAAFNFLLWGAYHGALLVLHKAWAELRALDRVRAHRAYRGLARCSTFMLVVYGWLFFRVAEPVLIGSYTRALISDFGSLDLAFLVAFRMAPYIGIALILDLLEPRLTDVKQAEISRPWSSQLVTPLLFLVFVLLAAEAGQRFIYFAF
ncbi:MAG TPA: MBOAT family protein [Myxococcales bacterium]|nr:MBOAT family protein [Myxococcales bacterium]